MADVTARKEQRERLIQILSATPVPKANEWIDIGTLTREHKTIGGMTMMEYREKMLGDFDSRVASGEFNMKERSV